MTKYFIDTSDGCVALTDRIGAEFETEASARSEALQAVSDMARDFIHRGGDRDMSASVRDQGGAVIYAVKLCLMDVTETI